MCPLLCYKYLLSQRTCTNNNLYVELLGIGVAERRDQVIDSK